MVKSSLRKFWYFIQRDKEPYKTLRVLNRLAKRPNSKVKVIQIGKWCLEYLDPYALQSMWRLQFLRRYNDFYTPNPNPLIIDCGSNIGVSILRYKELYPNARIVAFEPDPQLFQVLERNVRRNALENIECIQRAIWAESGQQQFISFRSGDSQAGRIDMNDPEDAETDSELFDVKTVWLGEYLQNKVDFLKLDVEGAELVVLESCKELLFNVCQMMVEVHYRVYKPDFLIKILDLLKEAGFHIAIYQYLQIPEPFKPFQENLRASGDQFPVLWAWRD